MKIIFITREGYNLPGARIRCYNFAKELRKYGIKTQVLSFADTLGAKSGKEENKLKVKDKLRYNLEAFKKLKREKNAIFFLNRLHYHSFAPWILSILNGNKLIFDLDDWEIRENPTYYFGFWPSSKAEFLIRKIAKHSNVCIGASKFLVDYLSQFNKNTYYIPSGVDTEKFKPQKINKDNSKIIFSWIGTMHRRDDIKNIKFIIDCFLELRKKYVYIFLEIAGDGIYLDNLRQILNGYKDRSILLKGWISPQDMPAYLSKIDIGLVPLIQDTKFNKAKSPTKLFEYMAMCKPIVSSSIGELTEIIEYSENGLLAKDKDEFINKMDLLIADPNLSKRLSMRATEIIKQNYSLSILSEKLYKIL